MRAGYSPNGLAVADFNGDGIPDVAVSDTGPSSYGATAGGVAIYLGNGDGTFKPPIHYPVNGSMPVAIAVADFNGDGKMDICLLDYYNRIRVFLGNGDGTFKTPLLSSLATGQFVNSAMVVGDFNGDGKLDVQVAADEAPSNGGDVLFARGNGDGTFAAATASAGGSGHQAPIATGDLNGDGKPDIVWGSAVLLGDGNGGFSPPVDLNTYDVPFALAIADLNGDGIPDIAMGFYNSGYVEAFLGNRDGTFQPGVLTATGSGICCQTNDLLGVADFNGDGHLDVFLANSDGVSPSLLLLGNGDGTFQAPSQLQTDFLSNGAEPLAVAVADLNGDMRPDLLYVGGGWFVSVLNTQGTAGTAIFPAAYDFGVQTVGTAATTTTVTIGNAGSSALQFSNLQVSDATDFSATTTCGSSVASGGSCSVTVAFNPQSAGPMTANVTFATNDPLPAANKISVTGNAIAPVVSTSSPLVQFSYQKVGTTSSPQDLQIANSGVGPLLLAIGIQGDFQQTNNCPASLAQGASCTVTITYSPLVPGSETGRLGISSNALQSQTTIALTGIGYIVGPLLALSPASLDFGSQYVGTNSAPSVVTVENNGDAPFSIASVTASSGFVPLSTCGNSVQPSFTCAIGIFFDPASTGSQMGTLSIADNLTTSPQSVTLTGNGTLISVAPATGSSTAQVVRNGQTAEFQLSIAPVSGYTGSVGLACVGLPAGFTCTLSQAAAVLNGSAAVPVTVSVSPSTTASISPRGNDVSRGVGGIVLACPIALIFLGAGICPRWRRRFLSIGTLAMVAVFAGSCGGNSSPASTSRLTYVFFLQSQPASSITVETPLTLTVQN